ncbi:MAG TPA: YciI family protein [Gemmatimonadales bacterium]|nr:YciI family protein [Gemmatimonadales bacterium]
MRFLMLVKADRDYEAGKPPRPELLAAIGGLSEEMGRAGVLLETGGLLPSFAGAKVKVAGGKLSVTDGPFTESKELVGGYAIIKAASKAEAIEHGRRFMGLHAQVLGPSYEGELEIRQLADFGPDA